VTRRAWVLTLALVLGCGASDPPYVATPAPGPPLVEGAKLAAVPVKPQVCAPTASTKLHTSPLAVVVTPELAATRATLEAVVRAEAPDPANPWAIAHGLVALGPDFTLHNGADAIGHVFAEYGELQAVDGQTLVRFPRKRGSIRIEPHTDLILKAVTESGAKPDRAVTVQGKEHTLADLYCHSRWRTWLDGSKSAFGSFNDMPWSLQGLAAWAPEDDAWTAQGGHAMTLDGFTHDMVVKLQAETQFMREAIATGAKVEKRKQGIFGYTCGGAHLLQGVAYAVGRGFGQPEDRAAIQAELDVLYWRLKLELGVVDHAMSQYPEHRLILLVQRLKFLGHFLESTHKAAAMGLHKPDEAQQATLQVALRELMGTVDILQGGGAFKDLDRLRKANEQTYLDIVGDSAHALHGIDLATGEAGVLL
jgi:hypothetical protein